MTGPSHPIALSTMWAQQERFAGRPRLFAETARDLGFTHIEINYAMPPEVVDELAKGDILPVSSLHQPAPKVDHQGRPNYDLNLASLDESERSAAAGYALATLRIAAACGASAVVVHLGAIDGGMTAEERQLRVLCGEGVFDGAEFASTRDRLVAWRRWAVAPYLAAARRSLDQLASAARSLGVVIGLEDRFNYHELPSLDEAELLLAELEPAVAGYWHDTGHAEVMHKLGVCEREAWLDRLGRRTVGSHLHDVDGVTDHRVPGEGDTDWTHIAAKLPANALRVFEINQFRPDEAVRRGIELLAAEGVI